MSVAVKFGLLALVSSAAAMPHVSHKRHHRKGKGRVSGTGSVPWPTGGYNSTLLPLPTAGTGIGYPEPTTTVINTAIVTETLISTIYATRPVSEAVPLPSPFDVNTETACGPATIVVTATEKITVTVSAGASSSVIEPSKSNDAQVPGYTEPSVVSSLVIAPSPAPSSTLPASSAAEAASSSVVAPSSSVIEVPSSSVVQVPSSSAVVVVPSSSVVVVVPSSSVVVEIPSSSAVVEVPSSTVVAVPSSTYVPPPSNGGSYSGKKRGLAYNDVNLCNNFNSGNIGFAYNWAQAEGGSLPSGVQYIPMMHKPSDSTPEAFLANVAAAVSKGTQAIMSFNEPDHEQQANLTPDAACTAWASYIQPIISKHPGVEILSPSVTNGPAPMGLDWLSRFQSGCGSATFHSVNIHWYDQYDPETINRFKAHIEKAMAAFPDKDIWLTEFGLNPGTASPDQASTFLSQALSYLDGNTRVKGYAWFMVGTDTSFNMLNAGTGLSATGNIYASS